MNGKLTIMCGGSEEAYARAEPVMAAYARQMRLLGPSGAGQLTKMVNQICIAGVVQGLAEGFSLARAAGLDIEAVVDVISKGAAQSWQMENRHKTMAAGHYDHGFAVEWMRKDLGICFEEARRAGVSLPVAALVDQFYAEVESLGGKRWDTSSLFARQEFMRSKGTAERSVMNNEQCGTEAKVQGKAAEAQRSYHHGDLRNGLLDAARAILEEQSLSALTLTGGRTARRGQPCRALSPFSQS